ncbi:hypothetical protein ElyMa_000051000 [Elysia marginata]|uniref:Uncharacterized protein n=1 Tax=Elysia marginata TaxID=1093978 RepID=A0AAV4EEM5_9GAST|nr:hypothetical protein ElyMa_000051000 [Elysia marginata]
MSQPVFVLTRNLPDGDAITFTNYDICVAASQSVGRNGISGAEKIGALWRIYVNGPEARIDLLSKGLTIRDVHVEISSQNPLIIRGGDGKEIQTTKLITSDLDCK